MATPVSIESPPHGHVRTASEQERDLQAKVQRMINLQYQEQKLANTDTADSEATSTNLLSTSLVADVAPGLSLSKRRASMTHGNLQGLAATEDDSASGAVPFNSVRGIDHGPSFFDSDEHNGVGKGTIDFSGMQQDIMSNTSESENFASSIQDQSFRYSTAKEDEPHRNQQHVGPQSQRLVPVPLPDYGSVQEQNHELYYGNPDHHDMDSQEYHYDQYGSYQEGNDNLGCCGGLFTPVYQRMADILSQENLHRSFCYGAIDGLLTGSGIVSAFWGLGLLSVRTTVEIRLTIVAFTVAACVADALCMAMGHIWTTYIVTSNHAWERSHERQLLEQQKSESKAKLVDMLLARGVLKIDAMSLADTLEGYPDLFVSSLVGDSLLSSGIQDSLLDDPLDDVCQHEQQRSPMYSDPATDFDIGGAFLGSFGSWKLPLHYESERDIHHTMEDRNVQAVCQESRKEGFFMMMGFSCFAVIPSLLWWILPQWFDTSVAEKSALSTGSANYSRVDDGESVNVPSLIILILSSIVWCLGVWKSHFVDSNWVVFGLETVAVLMMCILSAYGIAALLSHSLGLENSVFVPSDASTLAPTNNL